MAQPSTKQSTVLVLLGSVRAGRLCPQIASWVLHQAESMPSLRCELVDLADYPLPMDDEPGIPRRGQYTQPHTLAWSAKIASAQSFVFVTPQYNWGYPAALKNALDHLYKEWEGKPAAIVSYGGHGGGKCAEQLRQVLEAMEMRPVETMPGLTLSRETIMGGPLEPEKDFAAFAGVVQQALQELAAALDSPAGETHKA